jgi:adenylylsulfate kinase
LEKIKILIFGLPGSGKTTFAEKLCKNLDVAYFNADQIRTIYNDWDFSNLGRITQANRMMGLINLTNKNCVIDFVCPYDNFRDFYDIIVWMNTIELGRFEDTNKIFEEPEQVDYEITNFNYDPIIKELRDRLQ